MSNSLIPAEIIENKIYIIRGHKVMIDSDLALLYGVETSVLNQSVKRNIERFPEDFMFQLSNEEWESLTSQFVISKKGRGGRRFNPYVFTEYGILMLSNILGSKKAVAVSIQIVRVFAKLREMALSSNDLSQRLDELEKAFINYAKENNLEIQEIYDQLKYLTDITKPSKIGFKVE